MRIKYWLFTLFGILLTFGAITILLLNILRIHDDNRKLTDQIIQHHLSDIRIILSHGISSIPAGVRQINQSEIDRKHYNELSKLDKNWRNDLLEPGAGYLVWRDRELTPLEGNLSNIVARNQRLKMAIGARIAENKMRFKVSLPANPADIYAVKTEKGYLLKVAPRKGPEYTKDQWGNISRFVKGVVETPSIAYLIIQSPEKIILNYPEKLPDIISLNWPIADTLYRYGDIIEAWAPLPNKNSIVRVGFSGDLVLPIHQRLKEGQIAHFVIVLLVLTLFFGAFFFFRKRQAGVKPDLMAKSVLQQTREIVLVFSEEGKLVLANTAARKIFVGKEIDMEKEIFELLSELEGHISHKTDFSDTDTSIDQNLWRFSGKPVITADKEAFFLVLGQDISYLHQLDKQSRLEERLNAMNVLASGISHEIRNPLNAISMIFQRIKYEFPPKNEDDEYKQLTGTLANEITRLDFLINQFLSLTRPLKIKLESFLIKKIFAEMLLTAKAEIGDRKIILESEISPDDLLLYSDPDLIKQVLINLIRNAADAIGERPNGLIRIFANVNQEKEITLGVSDNGIGMDEKQKEEILNPFFTTKSEGTGLGLSIVQRIITQIEGRLDISSVKNVGSEFSLVFQGDENKSK